MNSSNQCFNLVCKISKLQPNFDSMVFLWVLGLFVEFAFRISCFHMFMFAFWGLSFPCYDKLFHLCLFWKMCAPALSVRPHVQPVLSWFNVLPWMLTWKAMINDVRLNNIVQACMYCFFSLCRLSALFKLDLSLMPTQVQGHCLLKVLPLGPRALPLENFIRRFELSQACGPSSVVPPYTWMLGPWDIDVSCRHC